MRIIVLTTILLLSQIFSSFAQEAEQLPFETWLEGVKKDALDAGVSPAVVDEALTGLEPIKRVVELDRNQPEVKVTLQSYLERRVKPSIIEHGLKVMAEHQDVLNDVSARYGVAPEFIAAIWGLETSYGRYTGGFSVIQALATLAYDPRRATYFRRELITALKIIDEGHIDFKAMQGSWAGAMGQSQFMPSSFLNFAQDFDGDGKRDIWTSRADVFASIAYYLSKNGWQSDKTWGRPVLLPDGLENDLSALEGDRPRGCKRAMRQHSSLRDLPEWQAMGIRRLNGSDLPTRVIPASVVQPDGAGSQAYIAYDNYKAILAYNCSNYYAIAVGSLADALRRGS